MSDQPETTPPVVAGGITTLIWANRGEGGLPALLHAAADYLTANPGAIVWSVIGEVREDSQYGSENAVVVTAELPNGHPDVQS